MLIQRVRLRRKTANTGFGTGTSSPGVHQRLVCLGLRARRPELVRFPFIELECTWQLLAATIAPWRASSRACCQRQTAFRCVRAWERVASRRGCSSRREPAQRTKADSSQCQDEEPYPDASQRGDRLGVRADHEGVGCEADVAE